MAKGLKIVLPSAVSDPDGKLRKLEHYYGIEFVRGASNGGGANGYYRLIGDDSLRAEMRFHNQIKLANVKDGAVQYLYNQLNLNLNSEGGAATFNGADGSDVMQIHTKTVYAVIGGSNATYERFIVSDAPFTYDGDAAIEFDPFGEAPDYLTVVDNKARSIYGSGVGTMGVSYGYDFNGMSYSGGTGFPRTYTSRYDFETFSRAKNTNSGSNLPYTIVYNGDIELATAFMFIECRTKVLTNVFGGGLSSDFAPNAATFDTDNTTGFKFTSTGGTETYLAFNSTLYNVSGTTASAATINVWQMLTGGYYPVLHVLDAQNGISNGIGTLAPVQDADGNVIGGDTMTGVYHKTFTFKVKCALASGAAASEYTVQAKLCVPMWRGRSRMWGNIWQWYAGYECSVSATDATSAGTNYDIYRAKSAAGLVTDRVEAVAADGQFSFENNSNYEKVGTAHYLNQGGWVTDMWSVNGVTTAIGKTIGAAAINNYESTYVYYGGPNSTDGAKARRGSLFGTAADGTVAVLRLAYLSYAPSLAASHVGSAFRVTLIG